MTKSEDHCVIVGMLLAGDSPVIACRMARRIEKPVQIPRWSEPEPDVSVAGGLPATTRGAILALATSPWSSRSHARPRPRIASWLACTRPAESPSTGSSTCPGGVSKSMKTRLTAATRRTRTSPSESIDLVIGGAVVGRILGRVPAAEGGEMTSLAGFHFALCNDHFALDGGPCEASHEYQNAAQRAATSVSCFHAVRILMEGSCRCFVNSVTGIIAAGQIAP